MTTRRPPGLLAHQWNTYVGAHSARANLLVHIVAVPVFVAANIVCVAGLLQGAWMAAAAAAAVMAGSLAAQGRSHRREARPPEPFSGPFNAALRILAEQWVTFPRFVLTGRWARALRRGAL